MPSELVKVADAADWRAYHAIRREVLWDARGRKGYDDAHPDDRKASHHPLLLKLDGRSIGTVRLDVIDARRGVVRLVAIAAEMQRRGHGRALSGFVDDYARRLGLHRLHVNAIRDAVTFYEKTGWTEGVWDAAELADSPLDIRQMSKSLARES